MPSRKKLQGKARLLKRHLARMQSLEALTDEQKDNRATVEQTMETQFGLPGLAADMAELREVQERIKTTVKRLSEQ